MREILFRGKSKKFGNWIEGSLIVGRDLDSGKLIYLIAPISAYYTEVKKVIPETIGQYTGLTDKNGTKIFEGDYWLDTDGDYLVYVVEFREGQFGFVCYGVQGALMPYGFDEDAGGFGEIDFSPFADWNMDLIKIIGNIHDNPELIGNE